MADQWYIQQADDRLGPYPLAQVYELLSADRISRQAWFSCDGVWIDLNALQANWPNPRGNTVGQAGLAGRDGAARTRGPAGSSVAGPIGESSGAAPTGDFAAQGSNAPRGSLAEAVEMLEDDAPPVIERDAILILGRRRAGKTIYLATLYSMLWKSVGGLTMKALSGPSHKMLMTVTDQLVRGQWPEATLGTRQLEFELNDHGRKRLLIAFDYSGEDFRRAFVDEDDSPEVKKLLGYVDRAAAVILLIDPAVATGDKIDEAVDDDFGMVQAVQRIHNWEGGQNVPVVLALTKADRNKDLIDSHGSAKEFVLRHYPALARTLGRLAIFKVCAVQESVAANGKPIPSKESIPINVDKPLLYCLERLHKDEAKRARRAACEAMQAAQHEHYRLEAEAVAQSNRRIWMLVAGIIIVGLCGCAVLYMVLTN